MVRRHLRRLGAPPWWPIRVKEYVWTVRPSPGPHGARTSIPLAIVVRDILRYAKTLREARYVIGRGYIKVDGVVRRDYKFPVGLMDILEIVPTGEFYRVVPHSTDFLSIVPIEPSEASYKLCRIEGKTTVKGGAIQLNLHDGRNIQLPKEEGTKYSTMGTVKISVPNQSILEYMELRPGAYCVVIGGRNVGIHGTLTEIMQTLRRRDAIATLSTPNGDIVRTTLRYTMVVGYGKPTLSITAK